MKTEFPKETKPTWYLVDANGLILGRLASEVAKVLRGKNKPNYSPHDRNGDFVIVINAAKVTLTGRKLTRKMYYHHTGYMGGMRATSAGDQLAKHPDRVITEAVKGMLPKNTNGRLLLKRLKVYGTGEHPHVAQQPVELKIKAAMR